MTQSAQSGLPMLMHPTIGTETRSPLLPRSLYSALVSSRDFATLGGSWVMMAELEVEKYEENTITTLVNQLTFQTSILKFRPEIENKFFRFIVH